MKSRWNKTMCEYLTRMTEHIPQLGGRDIIHKRFFCNLKMKSELQRLKIYEKLFKRGLEGSIVTEEGPMVKTNRWDACPFFERRGNKIILIE